MKYHYTYRIINIISKKEYIGVRTANILPELDLGIKYFSSSSDKEFISEQMECSYFEYKVISIHPTRTSAVKEEIALHTFFDIAKNEMYYNKAKQTSSGFDMSGVKMKEEQKLKIGIANSGKIRSEETKTKLSEAKKGIPSVRLGAKLTPETKLLLSAAAMGENSHWYNKNGHTEETKNKISTSNSGINNGMYKIGINHPMFGKFHSEETKKKISGTLQGRAHSEEAKEKMSIAKKGIKKPTIECPHCQKVGGVPQMKRWHFNNCKFINT